MDDHRDFSDKTSPHLHLSTNPNPLQNANGHDDGAETKVVDV